VTVTKCSQHTYYMATHNEARSTPTMTSTDTEHQLCACLTQCIARENYVLPAQKALLAQLDNIVLQRL
jgi:hypothetical protein